MTTPSEHPDYALIHGLLTTPAPEAARSKLTPIPWPAGDEPRPQPTPSDGSQPLPKVDVLVVTWTTAEAQALADVLSPGYPLTGWTRYTNGYDALLPDIRRGAPAYEEKDLGRFYLTEIAGKSVLLLKSDLHMSQDGPKLPVRAFWKQIIEQCSPKLVITTGTAGGVGHDIYLGDVIVTDTVRFDCQRTFKHQPFANATYVAAKTATVKRDLTALLEPNVSKLPTADHANGEAAILPGVVLTTDFFAFDNAEDSYGLRAYEPSAAAVEMGDAVLGLVCSEDISDPPAWVIVRNASDPQMPNVGTLEDQTKAAAGIYLHEGYLTTVGSAIVCWGIVMDFAG